MSNVVVHPKYYPLFELLEGKHAEVDTVIITGGRYSAKSFNIGLWAIIGLVNYDYSVLFTRYTNVSIVDSIKPNVDDKIELLGYNSYVNNTNTHIEKGKERIAFKGIKTGSSQQTANLKSLEQFNAFVVDEADEMPDYETFEKVFLSIRSLSKRNITILSLNPSSVQHWIFKKFFKDKGLKGGENVIVDNVLYIHTSYLDLHKKLVPDNILSYYSKLKIDNPKKYNHVVLGQWVSEVDGQVHKAFKQLSYAEFLNIDAITHSSIDFGASDPMAVLDWKFISKGENDYHLYFHERWYDSENETIDKMPDENRDIYKKTDGGVLLYIMNQLQHDKNRFTICDTGGSSDNYASNNFKIATLKNNGYNAVPAQKFAGSIHFGNELLKNINVYYTKESTNIDFEVHNYTLDSDREGFIEGKYIDKHNHCFTGETLITTKKGLIRIDQVKEGDLVLTSKGYKKVLKKFNNGIKKTNEYSMHFETFFVNLQSTKEHKIKTEKGWKKISQLKKNDKLFLHKNSTVKNIDFIKAKYILVEGQKECIGKFGNILKGKFQKDTMFTMLTETRLIMKFQILIWLIKLYTKGSQVKKDLKKIKSGLMNFTQKVLRKQKNGINQKKEKNGIQKTVKKCGLTKRKQNLIVLFVEKNMKHHSQIEANTAIQTVKLKDLEIRNEKHEKVYDLMVEDCHEYFANGVLVHNCVDTMRNAVIYLYKIGLIKLIM